MSEQKIKNIAIIAHVDHGKTTLVDAILKQTGTFRENQQVDDRVMDSNDLEREKGITIFSKNASFDYKDYKVNIVDTPGHADFGGEVQRIMKMVDSVLLLVDAFEGAMPQTKYVLKKSLELGLKPIVVINKIDRPMARPEEIVDQVFDLFVDLNASDDQLDFPVVYASAKNGFAMQELDDKSEDILPLLDKILEHVEDSKGDREGAFQYLVSAISYDTYVGRIVTGKVHRGKVKVNDEVKILKRDGSEEKVKISRLYTYAGMQRVEISEGFAGDIISIAGCQNADIGETIADPQNPEPLPLIDIDEPTIAMNFVVNDSPFAGQEGKWVTSRNIYDRLLKEAQNNVSIKIERGSTPDIFIVKGRGELQLAILIENMRREGYEFAVSRPQVIYKELNGKKAEPVEMVTIDVADEHSGIVIEKLGTRKGEMVNMVAGSDGYTRIEFKVPSRGLIGYTSEFLTDTRGTGIMNHTFYEYEFFKGEIGGRTRGSLVALESGTSLAYALWNLEDRGILFIGPGEKVYRGMVIGENSRENDLDVNVLKGKKLTNVRSSGNDDAVKLTPPRKMSLEQAIEYLNDDELLEITPANYRLRKKILDPQERVKEYRRNKKEKL